MHDDVWIAQSMARSDEQARDLGHVYPQGFCEIATARFDVIS